MATPNSTPDHIPNLLIMADCSMQLLIENAPPVLWFYLDMENDYRTNRLYYFNN